MTDPPPTEDPLTRAIDVLVRFFRHLDDGDYESLAGLLDGDFGLAVAAPIVEGIGRRVEDSHDLYPVAEV